MPAEHLNEYSYVIALIMIFQVLPEMGLRPMILSKRISKEKVENIFAVRIILAFISAFLMNWLARDLTAFEIIGVFVFLISRPYMDFLHFKDANEDARATIWYTATVVSTISVVKVYLSLYWIEYFWSYLLLEGLITMFFSYYNGFFYKINKSVSSELAINCLPLVLSSFIIALSNRLDVLFVQYINQLEVASISYSVMLSTGLYFILSAFFLVDIGSINRENFGKLDSTIQKVLLLLVFVPVFVHWIHTGYFTEEFKGNIHFTIIYSLNILLQLPLMRLSHALIKEKGTSSVFKKDFTFLILSLLANSVFYQIFGIVGVVMATLVSSLLTFLLWSYVLKRSK